MRDISLVPPPVQSLLDHHKSRKKFLIFWASLIVFLGWATRAAPFTSRGALRQSAPCLFRPGFPSFGGAPGGMPGMPNFGAGFPPPPPAASSGFGGASGQPGGPAMDITAGAETHEEAQHRCGAAVPSIWWTYRVCRVPGCLCGVF